MRSCGCLQRESRFRDIAGERRGYLTAIRPTGEVQKGSAVWEWRCDCGNVITALERNVGPGGRVCCGCRIDQQRSKAIDRAHEVTDEFRVDGTNILKIKSEKTPKNNTSGVKGVYWHKPTKKWVARIGFKGKVIYLGYYKNIKDAAAARKAAEEKYFAPEIDAFYKGKDFSNEKAGE